MTRGGTMHCRFPIFLFGPLFAACAGSSEPVPTPWDRCRTESLDESWTEAERGACIDVLLGDSRAEGIRIAATVLGEHPSLVDEERLVRMDEVYACRADPAGRIIFRGTYAKAGKRGHLSALERRILVGGPMCPDSKPPLPMVADSYDRDEEGVFRMGDIRQVQIACSTLASEGPADEMEACTDYLTLHPTAPGIVAMQGWIERHPEFLTAEREARLVAVYPCTCDPVQRWALRSMLATVGHEAAIDAALVSPTANEPACAQWLDLPRSVGADLYSRTEALLPEDQKARLLRELENAPKPPPGWDEGPDREELKDLEALIESIGGR